MNAERDTKDTQCIPASAQEAIGLALERGNSVEVKRNKDGGIVVYEVRKRIIFKS